jgi:hypothetical protein
LELQELYTQIDYLKGELDRLIESEAEFNEIYSVSVKLDKLIVFLYKTKLTESV